MKTRPSIHTFLCGALVLGVSLGATSCSNVNDAQWPDLMENPDKQIASGEIHSWLTQATDPCNPPEPWDPNAEEEIVDPDDYISKPDDLVSSDDIVTQVPSEVDDGTGEHIADGPDASMFIPAGWQPIVGGPLDGQYAAQGGYHIEEGPSKTWYSSTPLYHLEHGDRASTYSTRRMYHYDAGPNKSQYSLRDREHITDTLNYSRYKPRGWVHVDSAGQSHTTYVPPDFVHYNQEGPFKTAYLPPGWYHQADSSDPDFTKLKKPCDDNTTQN